MSHFYKKLLEKNKKKIDKAWEMVQSVTRLLHKHVEGLSSHLQHPCRKPGNEAHLCNPTGKAEKAHWPGNLATSVSSRENGETLPQR